MRTWPEGGKRDGRSLSTACRIVKFCSHGHWTEHKFFRHVEMQQERKGNVACTGLRLTRRITQSESQSLLAHAYVLKTQSTHTLVHGSTAREARVYQPRLSPVYVLEVNDEGVQLGALRPMNSHRPREIEWHCAPPRQPRVAVIDNIERHEMDVDHTLKNLADRMVGVTREHNPLSCRRHSDHLPRQRGHGARLDGERRPRRGGQAPLRVRPSPRVPDGAVLVVSARVDDVGPPQLSQLLLVELIEVLVVHAQLSASVPLVVRIAVGSGVEHHDVHLNCRPSGNAVQALDEP